MHPEIERLAQSAWQDLPPSIRRLIPKDDAWALTPKGRQLRLSMEVERRLALSARLTAQTEKGAEERSKFLACCTADPRFLFRHCLWTKDPERRMGCGTEIPLVPYSYMLDPIPLGKGLRGGGWVSDFHRFVKAGKQSRACYTKSRRMLFSITCMGFMAWALRFEPGFHAWASSVREDRIDAGDNFDALFGKLRFFWSKLHEFYPWLYPELPPWGTSSINKEFYVEHPRWEEGPIRVAEGSWGNSIVGCMANEASRRGGAALMGVIDEAAWVEKLAASLDDVEMSTTILVLASSVSHPEHPFSKRSDGRHGYETSVTPVLLNPMLMEEGFDDPDGVDFVPWVRKHRSRYICEQIKTLPPDVFERNVNINPRGAAGSRVLNAFTSSNAGSPREDAPDFDLYDPRLPVEIWFDSGRRDAWAVWWVQIADMTQQVRLVDFWMREDVSVEWWLPLILGWPPEARDKWVTLPDRQQWKSRVPWPYGDEDFDVARTWNRRYSMPGAKRPKIAYTDTSASQRQPNFHLTVQEILAYYGISCGIVQSSRNVEAFIDHANLVIGRTKIEGRIADRHPVSGGVSFPTPVQCFSHWEWLPSTPKDPKPHPAHDIYSHPCTAFVHGVQHLPATIPHKFGLGDDGRPLAIPVAGPRTLVKVRTMSQPGSMFSGPAQ